MIEALLDVESLDNVVEAVGVDTKGKQSENFNCESYPILNLHLFRQKDEY